MADTCQDWRRQWLIGQADPRHEQACAACNAFVVQELRAASLLRAQRSIAPDSLRQSIAAVVAAQRSPVPLRQRRSVFHKSIVLVASVLLLIGAALWLGHPSPLARERADQLVQLMVDDYLEYAHRDGDKLQLATNSPQKAEAFFRDGVRLAAHLPTLDAELQGGRTCYLAGRPTALAFFATHRLNKNQPVSVLLLKIRAKTGRICLTIAVFSSPASAAWASCFGLIAGWSTA